MPRVQDIPMQAVIVASAVFLGGPLLLKLALALVPGLLADH